MELRSDLVLRKMGDDHVIVDPSQDNVDMSKVFSLNASAAWLWKQLEGQDFNKETMVDLLRQRFEVSEEQAKADVTNLTEIFQRHGLLK